jgi:hypothetical protein
MRASPLAVPCLLLAAGCNEPAPPITTCGSLRLDRPVFVVEEHASLASGLGLIDAGGCFHEVPDASLSGDGLLARAAGRTFFIDRQQGVLDEIDTSAIRLVGKPIAAYGAGEEPDSPNPYDVDIDAAGRLWIARNGLGSAVVRNADGSIASTIDLSDLDPDAKPDMDAVRVAGDRVYIALQLLDYTQGSPVPARRAGIVAVIDDAPPFKRVKTIDLAGRNPFGPFVTLDANRVIIPTPGFIGHVDATDGIDVLDLPSGTAKQLISETELGGSPVEVVVAGPTEAYAIVAGPDPDNPTSVVRFDPSQGKRVGPPVAETDTGGFDFVGLAVDGDLVLFGDRNTARSAILAVDRNGGGPKGSFTAHRLPPWALLTLEK